MGYMYGVGLEKQTSILNDVVHALSFEEEPFCKIVCSFVPLLSARLLMLI